MKRWRQVALRSSFDKYRRGVHFTAIDDNNNRKISSVRDKIAYNQKKRVFYAILSFKTRFHQSKQFIRNMILRVDKRKKTLALNIWNQFRTGGTGTNLKET